MSPVEARGRGSTRLAPLLPVLIPVSTVLALFLPQLALAVVATLSCMCGVRVNVRMKRLLCRFADPEN